MRWSCKIGVVSNRTVFAVHGVGVELNILMTFPQALRVVEITVFLKQGVLFDGGVEEWQI